MNSIGAINPMISSPLTRVDAPLPKIGFAPAGAPGAAPTDGFTQMLDGLVATVDAKQQASQDMTRKVLLGESDQLHQSVIAMQEASVAFSLMVEVRNKLVESYQELMRMQV
ncbi:MAG TPA: flagellar hook-basal body complex protein FliE [Opitutaceae bacterium]|nr:flagellar hook-basal body complex protein FliE [Opitutaceae bacterium]